MTSFGRVISVRGSLARVGLLAESQMPISEVRATVGRFVSIRSASSVIVAMITEVSCENLSSSDSYIAVASVDLLGEILNASDKPKFQRGVTNYPTIGDSVDLITSQELRTIYAPTGSDQINVGFLQQDRSVVAYVDVEEMLSKHFAVLGSTGVGKSTGVSLLLNEILKARPNLRIFLLDVHNEYGRCFGDRALVLNPRNLKLPFWLFNFEEIVDVLFGGRAGVPEELDILAEVIPLAKGVYTQYQNADRIGLKRIDPKQIGYTVDTPVPYRLVDLMSLIDERMGKLENRSSRIIYHKLISRIEAVRNDPRYAFMFDNANVGGDTMAEVISHLFRLPANGKPMTVMQLAGFPAEVIDSVVSVLCRMALRFRPVERRRLAPAVRLRGSASLRLRRPQYRLRPDPQGGVAHRQGRPQIRRLSRPHHPASGRARRHHHLPVQHAVHDASCQRARPGAAARRGVGRRREPALLRALAWHA
ncbi:DNA helicase HerA-like ATPase [Bradyrhizobium ottawaense]